MKTFKLIIPALIIAACVSSITSSYATIPQITNETTLAQAARYLQFVNFTNGLFLPNYTNNGSITVSNPSPSPSPSGQSGWNSRVYYLSGAATTLDNSGYGLYNNNLYTNGAVATEYYQGAYYSNGVSTTTSLTGSDYSNQNINHYQLTNSSMSSGNNTLETNLALANFAGGNINYTSFVTNQMTAINYQMAGDNLAMQASMTSSLPSTNGIPQAGVSAILTGASFAGDSMKYAILAGDNAQGINATGTAQDYSNYYQTDLTGSTFQNAHMAYTGMTMANLTGANLSGATFTYANLVYANLSGANFTGATIDQYTSLAGAKISTTTKDTTGAIATLDASGNGTWGGHTVANYLITN